MTTPQQAGVSAEAVAKLVAKWRDGSYGSHSFTRATREKCADELESALESALATAPPEQAVERCPTCTSSVRTIKTGLAYGKLEPGDCNDKWHDPLQAASVGALSADFFLQHETNYTQKPSGRYDWRCSCGDSAEDFASWTECHRYTREHWAKYLNITLAAHDQKVRAEVLEEAAQEIIRRSNRDWKIGSAMHTELQHAVLAIRSLASGAEEKEK